VRRSPLLTSTTRTATPRTAITRTAPALAVLALTAACAGTAPSATTTTAPPAAPATSSPVPGLSPSASSAPSPSAGSTTASASPTSSVQELEIEVSGSKVTGDTGTVDVRKGQPVRVTVTSDVADEVHVHGADVSKDVEAGGTVVLEFTQQAAGRFEVELEGARRVLTRLQVR